VVVRAHSAPIAGVPASGRGPPQTLPIGRLRLCLPAASGELTPLSAPQAKPEPVRATCVPVVHAILVG